MLGDADLGVRIRAAWALSKIGDRNCLPRLAAALGDSMNGDAHLARQLIVALADIGGREATDDIAVALQSSIPEARGVAAHFLDYVGGERARQLLAEHLLQETDADVRAAIEEALQT
jgi:HEAT repeat protein